MIVVNGVRVIDDSEEAVLASVTRRRQVGSGIRMVISRTEVRRARVE
jgi:hypothetical protein